MPTVPTSSTTASSAACATSKQYNVIELSTDAADPGPMLTLVKDRFQASGLSGSVAAGDGDKIDVTICQADVSGVLPWLAANPTMTFRAVFQTVPISPDVRGAPISVAGMAPPADSALPSFSQRLAWQPSDSMLAQFAQALPNGCPKVATFTTMDAAFGAGFACSSDKQEEFLLGPQLLDGTEVQSTSTEIPDGQLTWEVGLRFTSQGAADFAAATQLLSQNYLTDTTGVTGQFAVVVDGAVISAPVVRNGPINDGTASISGGDMNEQSVKTLAALVDDLRSPVAFTIDTVETITNP